MRFREPVNAWSHLVGPDPGRGAGPSLLLHLARGPAERLAFAVYGGSLILLYAASTALPRAAPAAPPAPTAPHAGPHRDLLPDRGHLHAGGACHPARLVRAGAAGGRLGDRRWPGFRSRSGGSTPRSGSRRRPTSPWATWRCSPPRRSRRAVSVGGSGVAGGRGHRLHGGRDHLHPRATRSVPGRVRAPRDLAPAGAGRAADAISPSCCSTSRRPESERRAVAPRPAASTGSQESTAGRRHREQRARRRRSDRPIGPGADRVLTPEALALVAGLTRQFRDERDRLLAPAPRAPAPVRCGRAPGLSAGDRRCRGERLDRRRRTGRPRRPPGRDHRPGRAQDDDQRPQLGREGLHGGLRGRALAALDQRGRRPDELHGRGAPHARVHQPRGQALPARRSGSPTLVLRPRGWHLDEAHARGRRPPGARRPVRLRPLSLTTTPASCCAAEAAHTSTCPSSRATSRRGSGTLCSTRPRTRSGCPEGPFAPPS